jgi:transcriptional regulator with XRE-family HTH domain
MAQDEQINPKMLVWARETAGLSVEEAADKLGLKDMARARGVDKLRALEAGQRTPSRAQLLKPAVYRRPLIAFYLPEPPRREQRGEVFRAITNARARSASSIS